MKYYRKNKLITTLKSCKVFEIIHTINYITLEYKTQELSAPYVLIVEKQHTRLVYLSNATYKE